MEGNRWEAAKGGALSQTGQKRCIAYHHDRKAYLFPSYKNQISNMPGGSSHTELSKWLRVCGNRFTTVETDWKCGTTIAWKIYRKRNSKNDQREKEGYDICISNNKTECVWLWKGSHRKYDACCKICITLAFDWRKFLSFTFFNVECWFVWNILAF